MNGRDCSRRDFIKSVGVGAASVASAGWAVPGLFAAQKQRVRPNILFCLADDWSWPHASIAGDKVVQTPAFDRVARQGVLFTHAFVTAPSCTPSRGSMLTGQWHWRLQQGGNLWSTLPAKFDVYPDLLEKAGYHVGYTRKGWGPGRIEPGGRTRNPAGPRYKDFQVFLNNRPAGKPFCFWFGSTDPHRGYKWRSGVESGMKLDDVQVPACLPDCETVRTDICDYYWEVQRFDREVGQMLQLLQENGELDNTLVVISGDNGMPFPRCKANLYDLGTNVPLAACWPAQVQGGRAVGDFVSLADLAPTFLEVAGLKPTAEMTARSFLDVLTSGKSGRVDPKRDRVFKGMERHTPCRGKDGVGYPMRAVETHDFMYIHNFKPDRWPAGDPGGYAQPALIDVSRPRGTMYGYGDVDASPTKSYMIKYRGDPKVRRRFELAFEKRPTEELYDLRKDAGQLNNVAAQAEYAEVKSKLSAALMAELIATKDPRVLGEADIFDTSPYYGSGGSEKTAIRPAKAKP